jgi:D-alanyl-D-alanine dipeptidase
MLRELIGMKSGYAEYASEFITWLRRNGLRVTITSAYRSSRKQAELFAEYQRARARGQEHLPASPPGHSQHELGMAFDLHIDPPEFLPIVGHVWERLGGTWGGRFSDPVHFDFRPSRG